MIANFPLARYRFEFEAETRMHLPEYAGSALRGAFGHALKQLSCATRAKTCDGCMLASHCPYTAIFEPQKPGVSTLGINTPPVPYIIEPPQWGERRYEAGEKLAFHFTLIGRAADHLPLTIMAWRRALTRGVGAGDGTAQLACVMHESQHGDVIIHRPGQGVADHDRNFAPCGEDAPRRVTLEFLTPLRLQENGCAIPPSRLSPRPLLTALVRRASLLAEHYHGQPLLPQERFTELARAAGGIEGLAQMRWRDWTRHSSRQGRTMQLGGCMGFWHLEGDLSPFRDFLRLGEKLHVGKEASFGLGRYRICRDE